MHPQVSRVPELDKHPIAECCCSEIAHSEFLLNGSVLIKQACKLVVNWIIEIALKVIEMEVDSF